MKNKAFVFDLDDTLIDTSDRHYTVMLEYLKSYKIDLFSKEEYLFLRKKYQFSNQNIIAKYFSSVANEFNKWWGRNIESKSFLSYDHQIVESALLEKLVEKNKGSLILLSLRSNLETAETQFEEFSFSQYFSEVYFLPHTTTNPKIEMLSTLKARYDKILFIGDSESDAEASNQAFVDFTGVMTGFYPLSVPSKFSDINQTLKNILE